MPAIPEMHPASDKSKIHGLKKSTQRQDIIVETLLSVEREKEDAFLSVEVMHFIISTVKTRPPSSICTNVIIQIKASSSREITVAQFQV